MGIIIDEIKRHWKWGLIQGELITKGEGPESCLEIAIFFE